MLDAHTPDLIIDALLGFQPLSSSKDDILVSNLIRWSSSITSPILALEMPSGYDSDNMHTKPRWTLAMGLLCDLHQKISSGGLFVCDIGLPALYLRRIPAFGGFVTNAGEFISFFGDKYLVAVKLKS
jgi:YjeF-related protein N-terminus